MAALPDHGVPEVERRQSAYHLGAILQAIGIDFTKTTIGGVITPAGNRKQSIAPFRPISEVPCIHDVNSDD
jgi:hypothetical protein